MIGPRSPTFPTVGRLTSFTRTFRVQKVPENVQANRMIAGLLHTIPMSPINTCPAP
jgi:hypothetical protein